MKGLLAALALGAMLVFAGGTASGQPAGPPGEGPAKAGTPRPHRAGLPKVRPVGPPFGKGAPFGKGVPHGKAKAHAKAAHGGGHAVHVNWYQAPPPVGESQPFLATLFNFIVLGLLLGRFGYPPIREFVKARHEKIGADLAEAQRLRTEAEARLKEYEAKIANLDQEIAALLQELRAEGEAERARIVAAAEEQARRLSRDAESTIAQDMKRARYEIEQEAVTAAIATAEKILRERITDADQRGFIERYLVSLATEASGVAPPPPGRGAA
jgi:F-type H+-transporting ATPase subunit b